MHSAWLLEGEAEEGGQALLPAAAPAPAWGAGGGREGERMEGGSGGRGLLAGASPPAPAGGGGEQERLASGWRQRGGG